MQEFRRKFIDNLRENPEGRQQIECVLTNGLSGRCAMGLGLEGIGVDLRDGFSDIPYKEGMELMGFGPISQKFEMVWRLNDRGLSFEEIANRLEELWEEQS